MHTSHFRTHGVAWGSMMYRCLFKVRSSTWVFVVVGASSQDLPSGLVPDNWTAICLKPLIPGTAAGDGATRCGALLRKKSFPAVDFRSSGPEGLEVEVALVFCSTIMVVIITFAAMTTAKGVSCTI